MIYPSTLGEGPVVRLIPLDPVHHVADLFHAALPDPREMARYMYTQPADNSQEAFLCWLQEHSHRPHSVTWTIHVNSGARSERVGMIALYEHFHPGAMEIGGVWLGRAWRGTRVLPEAFLLVNEYAFDVLKAHRIQGGWHGGNARTPEALQRLRYEESALWAKEGCLREYFVNDDGTRSDYYIGSSLDHEWPGKRLLLESAIANAPRSLPLE